LDALDQLYHDILTRNFPSQNPAFMDTFRSTLDRVLAAREPLSVFSLRELHCDDDIVDITFVIEPLGSLSSGVNQLHIEDSVISFGNDNVIHSGCILS
jgi:hypothetical protein